LPDSEAGLMDQAAWADIAIVSSLSLTTGAGRQVSVRRADGGKCARCWRVLPEVGRAPDHPALCLRCADAVDSGLVCRPAA
jgi:isoleucyl-tRNA synthetase